MITLTQMEYVLAVAREGNFRRAAKSCHVTQPTLSLQVQKFEDYLDTILFDRSKNPVKLTKLGQLIIKQVEVAYIEALRVLEVVDNESGKITGELRVGVIPTIAPYLVPLFLRKLNNDYPDLELSVSELTTENCLAALDREEIDIAILATKEDQKKYQQEKLYDEELMLYVNAKHKFANKKIVHADDLELADIWLLEDGHCLKDEVIKICKLRREKKAKPKNLNLKVGSLEALRYLVEENFGYTLLPRLATLKLSKSKKAILKTLSAPTPIRSIQLTKRRRVLKSAAIEALKQTVLVSLPKK